MISIYRKINGIENMVCSVADDKATLKTAIMGINELSLDTTVELKLDIKVDDYVKIGTVNYYLNRPAEYDKLSDVQYAYSLVFEHPFYHLLDKLFTNLAGKTTFSMKGTLKDFVSQIVRCVNKTGSNPLGVDTGWTTGQVVDRDAKLLSFEGINCRQVLDMLYEHFGAEWYMSGTDGKTINFREYIETETGMVFEQGKGKGLYSIQRKNVDTDNTVTRVFPYGGSQNVPTKYADEKGRLCLAQGYIEVSNLQSCEYPRIVEKEIEFDDIYPHFIGTVNAAYGTNNSIIKCPEIDFNINNQLIGGVKAKVNFLSGDLMGLAFELTWNNDTKELTIIEREDPTELEDQETGKRPTVPSSKKMPHVGDNINFTDILMPDSYVTNARTRLYNEGLKWLNFYSKLRVKYELVIDYRYLRNKNNLNAGDVITIKITEDNLSQKIRIISLERNIKTGQLTCTVSNYLEEKWEKKIEGKLIEVGTDIKKVTLDAHSHPNKDALDTITSTKIQAWERLADALYIDKSYDSTNEKKDATKWILRTRFNFASDKGISALGVGISPGSGESNYDRLDNWGDYSNGKASYVLSAKLGYDNYSRINKLEEVATKIIDFSQLDSLNTSDKSGSYLVIHNGYPVGYVITVSDNMAHVIDMLLFTNMLLDNGEFNGGHTDSEIHLYKRIYNILSHNLPDISIGSWGEWKEAYDLSGIPCKNLGAIPEIRLDSITTEGVYTYSNESPTNVTGSYKYILFVTGRFGYYIGGGLLPAVINSDVTQWRLSTTEDGQKKEIRRGHKEGSETTYTWEEWTEETTENFVRWSGEVVTNVTVLENSYNGNDGTVVFANNSTFAYKVDSSYYGNWLTRENYQKNIYKANTIGWKAGFHDYLLYVSPTSVWMKKNDSELVNLTGSSELTPEQEAIIDNLPVGVVYDMNIEAEESQVSIQYTSKLLSSGDDDVNQISIPASTTEEAGVMSAADKTKLDNLPYMVVKDVAFQTGADRGTLRFNYTNLVTGETAVGISSVPVVNSVSVGLMSPGMRTRLYANTQFQFEYQDFVSDFPVGNARYTDIITEYLQNIANNVVCVPFSVKHTDGASILKIYPANFDLNPLTDSGRVGRELIWSWNDGTDLFTVVFSRTGYPPNYIYTIVEAKSIPIGGGTGSGIIIQ